LANYREDTTLPSFSNARRAKKRSLLFSRLCAEKRGLCGAGSGVTFFLLMYFDGLNLFVIMNTALVLTRQMPLLGGNQCFLLVNKRFTRTDSVIKKGQISMHQAWMTGDYGATCY